MDQNEKPGAGGTGPRNAVLAGRRNSTHHSGFGQFRQHCRTDELERARSALPYIDPRPEDTWLKVGMGLKAEFGDDGWPIFDEWSRPTENYEPRENRTRWQSFKPSGGITIASVYRHAREAGWRDNGTYCVPEPEELARRQRERAKFAAEMAEKCDVAATEAARKTRVIWAMASLATADNPYCQRKGIEPNATLREIDAGQAATLLGYAPGGKGEPLQGRLLVVPIWVGHKLSSLQLIDGAGRKHFLAGGTIAEGCWTAQALPRGEGGGLTVYIGEGVATVLSARQSVPSGLGIAAMSNGNIPSVARQMRENYPRADVVILADIDKTTGEPDKHAVAAAAEVGGRLAVPRFANGPAKDRKDLNDLSRAHGTDAVRQAIEAAKHAQHAQGNDRIWPAPQPLVSKIEPEQYPVDALPDGIREAVEEVGRYVQAPLPLVASSALSAMSLTCQHLIDVHRDSLLRGPSSLFFMSIAESGERKTTLDTLFNAPLREWQKQRAEEMKPEIDAHSAAHGAWFAECEGVRSAIKEAAKKGEETGDLKSRLQSLTESEPRGPRVPWLFLGDETPENLAWRLYSQWPSAGLVSSEAGVVFGGHAMGDDKALGYIGLINVLWDGGEHSVGRKTSQSFTVRGVRLTLALQVQEAALLEFIKRKGSIARGTGFWARFLISWPASTIGSRPYREPGQMPALGAFQHRLEQLLRVSIPIQPDGTLKPAVARLGPEAMDAFVAYYNAIEAELGRGGELAEVRDVAAKSAENAARLAALFQSFQTSPTAEGLTITADSFDRASRIVAWHLSEARRFFGELAMPDDFADAAQLEAWLIQECPGKDCPAVPKNRIRQYGPGRLRDGKRLDAALKVVADLDRVRVTTSRPIMIEVNPALLGELT